MKQLARVAASLFIWAIWQVLVVLWTPLILFLFAATAWWDRRRWITGRAFRWGARALVAFNPFWTVRVVGRRPDRAAHPLVVVSNHESLADVLLIGTLPWEMKWLSKASNFRVPFLGLMMWLAGDVRVRRDDAISRAQAYGVLCSWLERGVSVIIFPEGTRSRTEEMLPFRNGAFRLSIETATPILPLAVSGTRGAIQKGSMWFGRADVVLRILPPVSVEGLGPDDVEDLRQRVRNIIEEARRDG